MPAATRLREVQETGHGGRTAGHGTSRQTDESLGAHKHHRLLVRVHVRQRVLGLALCGVLAVLIASGYLLYYAGEETLREWTGLLGYKLAGKIDDIFPSP